ncbi:MAG TPA: hypothetical protein VFU35_09870 [Jatrophihabitans sp.]|nr:hypothetical protein [Jatrophihabitans sp.]
MTATATAETRERVLPPGGGPRFRGRLRMPAFPLLAPSLVAALNGLLFVLLRPDVNDLWAARARASAVLHGVGLTYWFSWFGGGSTPGNYSVVAPYLSAYLGTEVVGAVSALAVTALATVALRGTRHALAATWIAMFGAGMNLWSGRVPFLLGAAFAVAALIAVRARRPAATVLLTVCSILASPVAAAFLALGLSGTFLTTRTKDWRPIIAWAVGTVAVGLVLVALAFGTPGPEPFSIWLALEVFGGLILLYRARPPDHLRTTIWVTALATVALWAIPNGMGSNFARFVWYCLPVAVVALSARRTRTAVLLVIPALIVGASSTVADLRNSVRPVSTVGYYKPLVAKLDAIAGLRKYRVEVVDHGAHAGYAELLGHALLARGWETQEDRALNKPLNKSPLDPDVYKIWLQNNAVGYVALPSTSVGNYPEYDLVKSGRATYLHRIWSDPHWTLFRVDNPTPIAGAPARLLGYTQSTMTVHVPCACTVDIRVRWSKFLEATLRPTPPAAGHPAAPRASARASATTARQPEVTAKVLDDGSSWTKITTPKPGDYVLSGSIGGIAR